MLLLRFNKQSGKEGEEVEAGEGKAGREVGGKEEKEGKEEEEEKEEGSLADLIALSYFLDQPSPQ